MNGKILNCTQDEYFADPCNVPSLTPSTAKKLLPPYSPAHAWLEHPRLGGEKQPPSKLMDRGSLIHELLLGTGKGLTVIMAPDYRTKKAQQERDDAHANGTTPVLIDKYEEAVGMVAIYREKLEEMEIIMEGDKECAIEWEEQTSDGHPVTCRGMLDLIDWKEALITDFKTKDAPWCSPELIDAIAWRNNDYIQINPYMSAAASVRQELLGRLRFRFIYLEMQPPYSVVEKIPDGMLQSMSEAKWQRAVNLWHQCLTADRWPGYEGKSVPMTAPLWAVKQAMEEGYETDFEEV